MNKNYPGKNNLCFVFLHQVDLLLRAIFQPRSYRTSCSFNFGKRKNISAERLIQKENYFVRFFFEFIFSIEERQLSFKTNPVLIVNVPKTNTRLYLPTLTKLGNILHKHD